MAQLLRVRVRRTLQRFLSLDIVLADRRLENCPRVSRECGETHNVKLFWRQKSECVNRSRTLCSHCSNIHTRHGRGRGLSTFRAVYDLHDEQ